MSSEGNKSELDRLVKQTEKHRQTLNKSYQKAEDLEAALHIAQEINEKSKRYAERRNKKLR